MPTNEDVLKNQRSVQFDDGSAYELKTDSTPMVDAGTGKPLILRTFEFAFSPAFLLKAKAEHITVNKQQIFNFHWPQIRTIIWSDGLVASTDVDPRVIIGKKRYRIFLLCEPKFRNVVVDRPKTLQEIFKKKG